MAKKTKPKKTSRHRATQEEVKKMIEYRKGGATYVSISKELHFSVETIRRFCRKELSEQSEKVKITFKHIDVSQIQNPLILSKFVFWFSCPALMRNPKTQREFSKQQGVDEDTLTKYKQLDFFWDEVRRHSYQDLREYTADVIYGQAMKGKRGDARSGKLFLEAVENHSSNVNIKEVTEALTDERMAEIAKGVGNWRKHLLAPTKNG